MSEEWVDTLQASVMIGHSNRRYIGELVKQKRLVGRRVEKIVSVRMRGMRYEQKRLREVLEINVESIHEYMATKGFGRNNPRPNQHTRGDECRCKKCTSEGLTEMLRIYATHEMRENVKHAAKRLRLTQAELMRQAIVEFLDTRDLLEEAS